MLPVLAQMKISAPCWIEWVSVDADGSIARVIAHMVKHDGEPMSFALILSSVWDDGPRLVVREGTEDAKLPYACPERHINRDGTFCLGRGEGFVRSPNISAEAEGWWGNLGGYLGHQIISASARSWPHGYSWRHGGAAEIEELLENYEARLPSAVVDVGRAAVRGVRPPSKRHPCPCGSKRRFDRCHFVDVGRVLDLYTRMLLAEREYICAWDRPCCGTMKNCPVRRLARANADRVLPPVVKLLLPSEEWTPQLIESRGGAVGMRLIPLHLDLLNRRWVHGRQSYTTGKGSNRAMRRAPPTRTTNG